MPNSRLVVIVCGGRAYSDRGFLNGCLGRLRERFPAMTVITGGATGADAMAADWARVNDVPQEVHYADWDRHGRAAGPKRNRKMLATLFDYKAAGCAVGIVAFPGGKGTADMKAAASERGVPVWEPAIRNGG